MLNSKNKTRKRNTYLICIHDYMSKTKPQLNLKRIVNVSNNSKLLRKFLGELENLKLTDKEI